MKKDINIPTSKNVHLAIIPSTEGLWEVYLLNAGNEAIDTILIVSKGQNNTDKTASMRRSLALLEANSHQKIELLQDVVLGLDNTFFITYFKTGKLYEKRFFLAADQHTTQKLSPISLLGEAGIYLE